MVQDHVSSGIIYLLGINGSYIDIESVIVLPCGSEDSDSDHLIVAFMG